MPLTTVDGDDSDQYRRLGSVPTAWEDADSDRYRRLGSIPARLGRLQRRRGRPEHRERHRLHEGVGGRGAEADGGGEEVGRKEGLHAPVVCVGGRRGRGGGLFYPRCGYLRVVAVSVRDPGMGYHAAVGRG